MFIYDLHFMERRELCNILNQNEKWKELAAGKLMNLPTHEISCLGRQTDPTESLLEIMEQKNHTVQELFVCLYEMDHYRAMAVLKKHIDEKYHGLIKEGDNSLTRLLSSMKKSETTPKELNCYEGATGGDDLNIKGSYDLADNKLGEKKLNIVLPSRNEAKNHSGEARSISPAKSSSGEFLSRESNIQTEDIKRSISEIPFHELERATENWSERNILGKGGFGTVYQGEWKNTKVAVKVFKKRPESGNDRNEAQMEQLIREMQILDSIRHDNILSVYGFSFGHGSAPCIVYQLMENGSLEDRLQCKRGSAPLTWYQRFEITRGTARGLQFLHTKGEKPLIHGDIKSANILLDANYKPYIGDFGLAREGPIHTLTHLTVLNVNGTKPYLPHDYLMSRQISTKVDAYSFGIVMFEIATGKRAYDRKRKPEALKDIMRDEPNPERLMDCAGSQLDPYDQIFPRQIFNELVRLGRMCTAERAKVRPEVLEVLQALERLNVPSRGPSVASQYPLSPSPFDLQRFYDIRNSGEFNMRLLMSRMSYQYAPASPSINIPEFAVSTRSTLPTPNPFPSPVSPQRFPSSIEGPPLLMVHHVQQPMHNLPKPVAESPLLQYQNTQPPPIQVESPDLLPAVLPGGEAAHKDTESSQDLLPLLTALGLKTNEVDKDKDEVISSDDENVEDD
ncbi:pelle-like serine/threonine-protein kinase pik-1 isoform X2 [Neocloeon triangulifer]|uniref:pelle-like serine/threonine-protein kinase pik-1 isoform X2 n=1 Tax=Neocloeon triangulifer TaxID=2078957 RepID=UPI00286F7E71|nr:pelle-like serine/threonine-protein kinase pik-1 isoform X2 [Neocloeon triangulifer]